MNVGCQIILEIVMGLFAGVISGIIASKITERLRVPPSIYICPQIAKCEDGKFRIKIINESEDDAYDISFYIRLIDPKTDMRFVIMGSTIPILKGIDTKEKADIENVSGIYPQFINKQKIDMLPKENHIKIRYEMGSLSVIDFCEEKNGCLVPKIDVVITAKNARSGRSMTFVSPLTCIVEGEWEEGERSINTHKKSLKEG